MYENFKRHVFQNGFGNNPYKYIIGLITVLVFALLISSMPVWLSAISLIFVWTLNVYYIFASEANFKNDVDNQFGKLENLLERKSHKVYKIQIITGVIMIVGCSYIFINIWFDGIPELYYELKYEVSKLELILSCLALILINTFFSFVFYLGGLIGLQFVVSGIIMLPIIREYEKYQFALKTLKSPEEILNENRENEEDWTIIINKAHGHETIRDIRNEWFSKKKKKIIKHHYTWSIFEDLSNS